MPKCRICDQRVPSGVELCPKCGAPASTITKKMTAELEKQLLDMLDRGQESDAIARYREGTGASLSEAKLAIRQFRQPTAVPNDLDAQLRKELLGMLDAGQKIKAIKIYKEHMNCGLAEAKAAVEGLAAQQGISRQGSGCASILFILAAIVTGSSALLAWRIAGLS